jgi:hypothetical protein
VRRHSRADWDVVDLLSSRGRELDHQFSGYPSAVFHLDALRLCRSRTSVPSTPIAGVLRLPGLAAGHVLARRAART